MGQASADALILIASATGIIAIVLGERLLLRSHANADGTMNM